LQATGAAQQWNPNPSRKLLSLHHFDEGQEIFMRSKLAFSLLVVASLFGATTGASAQTEPATRASAESNASGVGAITAALM
jgi:hypothetical protein